MKTIVETERLVLREFSPKDANDMFQLNADPEVIKYTGDPPFTSVNEAEVFLKNYSDYERNGFGRWAVISKQTGEYLGWCGLKLNEQNLVDIGFRFFRNQWGKGFATESARATLKVAFNDLKIDEVIGRASRDNLASVKVLEKLNMKFWKFDDCKGIANSVYYKLNKEQYDLGVG